MPELTPNFELKKPLGNERVTRVSYNENLDIIDQNVQNYINTVQNSVAAHLADLVTDVGGVHGLKVEEGAFTPELIGTGGTANHTYVYRIGRYYKIGNMIRINLYLSLSAKDPSMTGTVRIAGLPFVSQSNINNAISITDYRYIDRPTDAEITGRIPQGTTHIDFPYGKINSGLSVLDTSSITNTTTITITGIYMIN